MTGPRCFLHELHGWFVASHEHYGESIHGHNFQCRVQFDWTDMPRHRKCFHEVVDGMDYRHLNRLPFFRTHTPSTENIARYVYQSLSEMGCRVHHVEVVETTGSSGGLNIC